MNTVRLSNISLKDFRQFLFDTGCSRTASGTKGRGGHEKWEKEGFEVRSIQGKPESGWMIVDGGDVVVHLFVAWQRKEVKLDELINNRNAEIHAREA